MLTVDASVWVSAFDPQDRHHAVSVDFLRVLADRRLPLNAPSLLVVETACALARLFRSVAMGLLVAEKLRAHPTLRLVPLRDELTQASVDIGTESFLRGADAVYAATARATDGRLVSWDRALVARAGAVTPDDWLARSTEGIR